MAYTKTNWNENTPITADKLNNIETGIANGIDKSEQIMRIPITNSEGWQQFRWISSNHDTVSWTRDAPGRKALEIFNESTPKQLLLLNDNGNLTIAGHLNTQGNLAFSNYGGSELSANISSSALHAATGNGQIMTVGSHNVLYIGNSNTPLTIESNRTPDVNVGGTTYQLYHTGNKPTPGDIGALPIHGGTLTGQIEVQGESRFYNRTYTDPWHGQECSIKASGHVGIGGSLKVNEKLAFSNIGTGGGLNANIHNLALHSNTGNGQMLTADSNRIYVGNPNTHLTIESSSNPLINVGGNLYNLYHTGNKPTAWDIGAMSSSGPSFSGNMIQAGAGGRDWIYHINADMGSLHIAPHNNGTNDWDRQIMFDRNGVMYCNGRKKVPTMADQHAAHYMFRYGSGIGGADGYITFSY